jgi:DmsE family decaheme c-type cytochrome
MIPWGLLLVAFVLWTTPAAAQDERALGNPANAEGCLSCHDQPAVTSVLHTVHMVIADTRTDVAERGCQSCHGDSHDHVARVPPGETRPTPAVVFAGPRVSPVAVRNEACAGCHRGGTAMHWQGSLHATSELACTSCHTSHPVRDRVLAVATQAPVCFSCHADKRAAALKPSHHPVLEGRMTCADCHNPHGSLTQTMLRGATINDTCLTCHDEKRGPFLWEHAPVQEECTICHTPHGTAQASLLKQRPPYLCQNCHDSSLHNSQPFSGASLPGGALPSRQMILRACLNCHSAVHGSNHPSGVRLSR